MAQIVSARVAGSAVAAASSTKGVLVYILFIRKDWTELSVFERVRHKEGVSCLVRKGYCALRVEGLGI